MSTTTDVLSLFKYDPVADADSTFNITQGLNNNWDKLDAAILLAIAAAGAYNPEESYAVGDYCTYKGKLRKCSTAIPTGETWTEAHWTTTTVAEELAELSSQLSNKVGLPIPIPAHSDLNNYTMAGLYYVGDDNTAATISNAATTHAFSLLVEIGADGQPVQTLKTWHDGIGYKTTVFIRSGYPEWGAGWQRIPITAPPQEYDLPLETSVFANYDSSIWLKSSYRKSQTGIVTVTIMGRFATDLQSSNDKLLANLPVGYLPKGYMRRIENTLYESMVQIDISNSGSIYVRGSAKTNDWLCCELSFVSVN